jgi:nucleoside-diphosphate-sugar epimerase
MDNIIEERLFEVLPKDSYGFGQNIKSRLSYRNDKYYTLRIFNCFGPGEPRTRLIPKYLASESQFKIRDDRYFDYFGIDDLYTVVKHFTTATYKYAGLRDINCVYKDKVKISEFLSAFCETRGISNDGWAIESSSDLHYTGSGEKLNSLGLDLLGLKKCLERYR